MTLNPGGDESLWASRSLSSALETDSSHLSSDFSSKISTFPSTQPFPVFDISDSLWLRCSPIVYSSTVTSYRACPCPKVCVYALIKNVKRLFGIFFPTCTQRWGVSACGGQVHHCSSLCLADVCVPNLLLIWQCCVGARAASPLPVVARTHARTHAPPPLPFVWHTSNVPLPSWPLKKEPFYPLKVNV